MLKIKDNKMQKRYKGYWIGNENSIDDTDIDLDSNCEKSDITYIIDYILKNEGYDINFENCVYFGQDAVITYEFNEKYSIDLFEFKKDEKYTLSLIVKELNNSNQFWELLYLSDIFKKIVNKIKSDNLIKADLVEEVK